MKDLSTMCAMYVLVALVRWPLTSILFLLGVGALLGYMVRP